MIVKTRVFELCDRKYGNLARLASAMGISVSQIYRVKEGQRSINHKFIVGAALAFPSRSLDELFYIAADAADKTN
ncbi:MAG: hypothetical protein ABUK03_01895 [Dehalococcoidales bacterium]